MTTGCPPPRLGTNPGREGGSGKRMGGMARYATITVLVVLTAAVCSGALAATKYVAKNGSCSNHGSIGSDFVSCADSRAAGCTAEKPCCTYQDGMQSLSGSGDQLVVHSGTYQDATGYQDTSGSYGPLNARYAARVDVAGVTVRNASGDAPTLDLGTTNHSGILITADDVTVEGMRIINGAGGTDSFRVAHILVSGSAGTVIRSNTLEVGTDNHPGTSSGNMCIKLNSCHGFDIDGNTCSGGWDFSIWAYSSQSDGGGVIRNNTQNGNGRNGVGPQRGIILQALGNHGDSGKILVYNNVLHQADTSGSTFGFYLREIHWEVYLFNNYVEGVNDRGIYFQDDACGGSPQMYHQEEWYIFNNTFVAAAGGGNQGIYWPGCVEGHAKNNIFKGFSAGTQLRGECPLEICSSRDDNQRSPSNSHFTHDLCEDHSACVHHVSGGDVFQSDLETSVPSALDEQGWLTIDSGAIDQGTDNPIGQGADQCLLTVGAITVDCTRDIHGDSRTVDSGWDIGMDEFTGGSPISAPTNLHRGDTR